MKKLIRVLYKLAGRAISALSKTDYDKVVLICNYGRGYLCNPKYIAEALNRLYPGQLDLVLLVEKPAEEIPPYIRQAQYRGYRALKELATARVWIDNCRGPKYIPKRTDQFYIQTWHAYLQPKRVEKDAGEALVGYVPAAMEDGRITDIMFADNDLQESIYKSGFWYEGPIVRCGVPRNAPLLAEGGEHARRVKGRLGLAEDVKICLYAPTFRKDFSLDGYQFNYSACLKALESRFGGEFALVYKLHPNLAKLGRPAYLAQCVDATDYIDAQELLAASDVMISDYSSILEDFALTGRPGFIFAPDIADYMDDRGFYYPLTARPFPVAESSDQLIAAIEAFDEDASRAAHEEFFAMVGLDDDGRGDEAVANIVRGLCQRGSSVDDVLAR